MCKIFVSLLVFAAFISLSKSDGILPTKLLGKAFGGVSKPAVQLLAGSLGGVFDGPSSIDEGSDGAAEIANQLAENIETSGKGGTIKQVTSTLSSATGLVLAIAAGASTTALKGNITEALEAAQERANTGNNIGNTLNKIL